MSLRGGFRMGNTMGAWEAYTAIKQENFTLLRESLESQKVNPNLRFRGESLLSTAVNKNSTSLVQLLLENGANPNMKSLENGRNETPLITATRLKYMQMVLLLFANGADIRETNFYGQDAVFQAVVENAFDILEYYLTNMVHGSISSVHVTRKACPLTLAIKDAPLYPLKKKCLLILLKYNYTCPCLQPECSIFSEIYEYEFFYKTYEQDPDILRWIYLSKGLRVYFMHRVRQDRSISFALPLKLTNLVRISIRDTISKSAIKRQSSFVFDVLQLPLPKKLIEFLLMMDLTLASE